MNWLESHGKIISRYEGNGVLEHEEGQSQVSFQVVQLASGKILCECEVNSAVVDITSMEAKKLIGRSDKYEIIVSKLAFIGSTGHSGGFSSRNLFGEAFKDLSG